jgi:hypothetical protein
MLSLIILLAFSSGPFEATAVEPSRFELSSENHSSLFYPMWFFKSVHDQDGVWFAVDGDRKTGEGVAVYRLDETGLNLIQTSEPRSNLFYSKGLSVSQEEGRLFLLGNLGLNLFEANSDEILNRMPLSNSDVLLSYGSVLIRGVKFPKHELEVIYPAQIDFGAGGEENAGERDEKLEKAIARINRQLSSKKHPSEGYFSVNEMIASIEGSRLAVSTCLGREIQVFDLNTGERLEQWPIEHPFRDWIEPPDTRPVLAKGQIDFNRKYHEWIDDFDRCIQLSWCGGEIYGLFRRGYDGSGVWAKLSNREARQFTWNNNGNDVHLLAMGADQFVLGQPRENSRGEVVWKLWRSRELK